MGCSTSGLTFGDKLGSKRFFLKKEAKIFICSQLDRLSFSCEQKFFGSSFQKRIACFLLALVVAAPSVAQAAAAPICLRSYDIDHTDEPDDHAILFTMRDHSVYRANVVGSCPGLHINSTGFTYSPDPGTNEICGNLFTIRLNETGIVCMMGAFDKISPRR